ncbi:MAG: VacJ family lipoprotein [Betaproteobacteria bacterium]|nr:VacJ family lipoprotein [Betaproteobacteria bacterium]
MKRTVLCFAVALLTGACATGPHRADPFEPMNRVIFEFNEASDKAIMKPIAQGYVEITPAPARTAINNFFGNLQDVVSFVNDLLQGKGAKAANDFSRVALNSSFGLLGLLDIASAAGIERGEEDFGQTLGAWGMGPGPYLVLPFFGPSNVRDGVGLVVDAQVYPLGYIESVPERNSATALRLVNARANLLPAEKLMEQAALDKYTFLRGAYSQRRQSQVHDGKPPKESDE